MWKSFSISGNLKVHILNFHDVTRKTENCDHCDESFTNLKKHTTEVQEQKLHKCNLCGKAFTQTGARKIHIMREKRIIIVSLVVNLSVKEVLCQNTLRQFMMENRTIYVNLVKRHFLNQELSKDT